MRKLVYVEVMLLLKSSLKNSREKIDLVGFADGKVCWCKKTLKKNANTKMVA